ncbi:MAG TPA: 30S ribosomal protein S12 methylthiotransferase RimO [Candidatus Cloacimonadota bacterium]|nr:30S ribosomal protein S12 methylthiotransferase RimO [Candidatus Cloacimonadota bacterium]
MKTYFIESLGCAKNLVDSEVFAHHLQNAGYAPADDPEDAKLVLINTCAFLQSSLAEFDEILSAYAERKNQGEIEQLLVSGCVMNRALEDFIDLFPEVDLWIPLKEFKVLDHYLGLRNQGATERVPLEDNFYRYLRISDGCNNHCSYCAIPSIRGSLRSKPMNMLVPETYKLCGEGAREIIMIAQDSAMYGKDYYGYQVLPKLLGELVGYKKIHWLRVLYLHPDHFDLSWLQLWKDHPRLLPYFEIPIQHSEDHILHAMNRQLGRAELLELFSKIREVLPNAIFRTTLISGFPGETAVDHRNLLDFIREVPFMHLGVFAYSREPGTPAHDMPKQVNEEVAERRRDELLSLHRSLMTPMLESYVGQTLEVLVESVVEPDPENGNDETSYIGRAWFQAPDIDGVVFISGGEAVPGTFIQVEVEDVIDVDLFARIV